MANNPPDILDDVNNATRPFLNGKLADEWLSHLVALDGDIEGMKKAQDFMRHSTAIVHGAITSCAAVPRLFDGATKNVMSYAATTMHAILRKVIGEYLSNSDYRKLFGFDPRIEELILLPCSRNAVVPFARYDIFLDEDTGDFAFCELNADGSSGMNEDREVARAMRETGAFARFERNHEIEGNELFESWIDAFLKICSEAKPNYVDASEPQEHNSTRNDFRVAICDYLECATLSEFEEYRTTFENRGISCVICDVRDICIENGKACTPDGLAIDAIWRRCVTNDILSNWNESQTFIDVVRHGLATLVGGFAGHIAHDKRIFQALRTPQTRALLSKEENEFVERHIPFTTLLDTKSIDLDDMKKNKDRWVVKPADRYGADEVHLGIESTEEQWSGLIDSFANGKAGCVFLAQRFMRPFRTTSIPLSTATDVPEAKRPAIGLKPQSFANLSGLYVYDGQFKGVFSRLGPNEIVTGLAGGLTAATFWVDCSRP